MSVRLINREEAERDARRAVRAEGDRLAKIGRTRLRYLVPVRTGKMKAHVKVLRRRVQRGGIWRLLSTVSYAEYVKRYHRAVARTRRYLRSKLRRVSVEVEVLDRHGALGRREIKLYPSRIFRLGGGKKEATIRTASQVSFAATGLRYEVSFE